MTQMPLQAMGEALKALRVRLTTVENHAKGIEGGLVDVFATYHGHITELSTEVETLKSENRDLQAKITQHDAMIIEILDVVSALKLT